MNLKENVRIGIVHSMEDYQLEENYLMAKSQVVKQNKQSHYKKMSLFTLVNLKDMHEVKVQSMHMFQDVLMLNQEIMY